MPEASGPSRSAQQLAGHHEKHKSNGSSELPKANDSTVSLSAAVDRTAALKARKRTKTGCLTCRKRRIKCGEERPVCSNCTKSKRDCEGYHPRLQFKDPLNNFRINQPGIAARTQQPPQHQNGRPQNLGNMPSTTHTPLAPRFPQYRDQAPQGYQLPQNGASLPGGRYDIDQILAESRFRPPSIVSPVHPVVPAPMSTNYIDPGLSNGIETLDHKPVSDSAYHSQTSGDSNLELSPETPAFPSFPPTWSHNPDNSSALPTHTTPASFYHSAALGSYQSGNHAQPPDQMEDYMRARAATEFAQPGSILINDTVRETVNRQVYLQNQHYGLPTETSWSDGPEDDYYDVESDEDDVHLKPQVASFASHKLGPLIAMSASQHDTNMRSMTGYLNEPNILAHYEPPLTVNPLMDPRTARIFCHFVTATAPTLAVCERHPINTAMVFSGVPVAKSQRSLWSYTMPMLAIRHQGLLHAMLALASLHICKLQGTSPTPSLKHYHYALKRVAKSLQNPMKKRDVATLAATLLLGYYEVTTAEHNKWNSHLSGARQLIMDIDFAGMARRIETHRNRQEAADDPYVINQGNMPEYSQLFPYSARPLGDVPPKHERQLDEGLISTLMGRELRYNQYGQVYDENEAFSPNSERPPTDSEIDRFEIQQDLFWWYAKQDMYQSIVSGNRLLFSYDRWGDCPPRAPIGRLNAVHGTLDHLHLLMGRLADFMSKDVSRKLRVQRAGQNASPKPQSGAQQPGYAGPNSSSPPTKMSSQRETPQIGYMPNPGTQNIRLPSGFDKARHESLYTEPLISPDKSLDTATYEAEREWLSIQHAFDLFHHRMGPDYQPLSSEHMTPITSPFGPAIYYRSYAIACVQALYYCGRIILERVHPSMPPAAQSACGAAARKTAPYANRIGQICAGIQPVDTSVPINPHHGAALMDCCMGLFHAGIQYRDPGQRGWTITKLRDVARLTGWQTSALIASGCEQAWIRAADMNRGPPYSRTMNPEAKDDRVAGRGRDPETLARPPKDNNDRRFIQVNPGTRVYWALGILGMDEDMKGLSLDP